MADESREMFNKIDAMLGKRAGFVVAGMADDDDDFPVLTDRVDDHEEEVSEALPVWPKPVADAMWTPQPAQAADTLADDEVDLSPDIAWPVDGIDRLAAQLEARLSPMLMNQLEDIEILIRRVVREELDARRD
jgi:hypothetical protein